MPPKRKPGRPPGSKNTRTKLVKIKDEIPDEFGEKRENSTTYLCTVCKTTFASKRALLQHKTLNFCAAVYAKPAYSCQECRKKFTFEKSYFKHLLEDHSKLPNSVACDHCHVRCPNKTILMQHIQKVHERCLFACPTCKKEFVRHSHVLRHLTQSGCNGQNAASYACEVCDAKFSRKDNLAVHIRLQHLFRKDFFCKHCLFNTKNFSKLVNHWHKYHSDTPDQYQCNECLKWISSRAAMMKHLEIHGEKKFACEVCGYSTFTVEVIRRHILTHVQNKPHKCHLCNRSYIQRIQLQRHLEKHAGNMCPECDQTFVSRAKMLIHLREHMGLEKLHCPFESCPYSTKKFMSEISLTHHLNIHFDNETHRCDVCDKKFHSEINLKRHLETHTLDKPRRCMYCVSARAYVRAAQLIRHVRKSHPALFRGHLQHVRQVLGSTDTTERVKKSEIESIVNLLDAEADRILQGYSGSGVLYGGMQEDGAATEQVPEKKTDNPLMSEEDLADSLNKLIQKLIDKETLSLFGWPDETIDVVLEKVIKQCGARPADRDKWNRVQRLRENTKHLFLYVIEDKNIARMLDTHTIDQIIIHILKQVSDDGDDDDDDDEEDEDV